MVVLSDLEAEVEAEVEAWRLPFDLLLAFSDDSALLFWACLIAG